MLTIIKEFRLSANEHFGKELESILNEFGADYTHVRYFGKERNGKVFVRVYFEGCTIPDNRFAGLIERLEKTPMNAGVVLRH